MPLDRRWLTGADLHCDGDALLVGRFEPDFEFEQFGLPTIIYYAVHLYFMGIEIRNKLIIVDSYSKLWPTAPPLDTTL